MPRNLLASMNTELLRAESDTTFLRKLRKHLPKQSSTSIIFEQRVMNGGRHCRSDEGQSWSSPPDWTPPPSPRRSLPYNTLSSTKIPSSTWPTASCSPAPRRYHYSQLRCHPPPLGSIETGSGHRCFARSARGRVEDQPRLGIADLGLAPRLDLSLHRLKVALDAIHSD
jgi:hypothetical protein